MSGHSRRARTATAVLAMLAGAAVVSAVLMLLAAVTLYEAAHTFADIIAHSLEETP